MNLSPKFQYFYTKFHTSFILYRWHIGVFFLSFGIILGTTSGYLYSREISPIQKQEPVVYEDVTPVLSPEEKFQQYLSRIDLDSDDSVTKFVNPDFSFDSLRYTPTGLQKLDRTHIIDTKWDARLIPEARQHFEELAAAFYEAFQQKVVVVSSYRSYNYQAGIKARWCPDNLCAKAGHSEHQSWLAIDLWSASTNTYWKSNKRLTGYYSWLSENAHLYGFHNTYQKGREIDGYEIEPWHWRYVGIPLAIYLRDNDLTLAEFFIIKKREG